MPASPTRTATAACRISAGGRAAIGAQVFPGFRPSNEVDESRSSVAGYVDVEGDVLTLAAARRRGTDGALQRLREHGRRQAHGARRADRRFVVRGSLSTGFRAPSLGQSFFSSTATNFLNLGQGLVPVESLTLPVSSAAAQALGAQPLKPEQSLHTSAGVVIAPAVRAGHHRRLLPHRHRRPHRPVGQLHRAADCGAARAVRRQQRALLHERDRHADQRRRRDGELSAGAAGGRRRCGCAPATTTRARGSSAPIATPPQLAAFESVLFDRIEQRRIECGQPKDSLRLGGDWRRNRFGVNLDVARYGEFCSFTLNPADDQTYPAKWLTDVEASYRTAGYTLAVGAQNLFNVLPGPQYDRQFVQRHPDVPEPLAVRDERARDLRAPRIDVLAIGELTQTGVVGMMTTPWIRSGAMTPPIADSLQLRAVPIAAITVRNPLAQ